MPNGTYSGSYYRIYLGSSFTNVTIEASVEFSGLAVDAVRGGSANAYTVTNYGSIIGQTFGIFFTDGGAVINKAGAYIDGVDLQGASGTIVNSGTIKGEVAAAYIVNELGGILDTSIYGYRGITVTNAGTINAGSGIGIRIAAPITPFDGTGLIINHTGGLIEGATGINVVNTTIIDYGTIKGSTEAVYLGADSELVVEVGAKLVGKVVSGGDAALEFGGVTGPGSFSGLGSGKISGSVAATLSGVDTYLIGADASWTITGANTVVSGSTLEIEGGGTLTDTGTITIDGGGVIIDDGSLSGSGSIEFVGNGGRFVLAGTAELGITLEGFAVSDQIDLSGIAFTAGDTATYTGGEFRFYNAADQLLATVHVQGELAGDHLLVVNDGAGDAEIIAVANGTYEGTYSHLTILHAGSPVTLTTSALVDATSGNAVNSGTSSAYTLINEGTVETTATSGIGIDLKDGGSVTNNLGGTIYGVYGGVAIYGGGGTVVNDGSIGGGTGGSPFDLHAGVAFFGGPGTLINTGTIEGDGQAAVYMKDGGVVTNTGSGAVIASIEFKKVPGSVVNDATIVGGVLLGYGGDVVNAVGATIGGTVTVGDYFNEPWIIGTIVNYGTIGAASFTSSGDLLVVEAGSSINGLATGGGGTFELGAGGGAGSLTGIGSGTLSGSAPAKVYGFSVYEIGSGADWTLTGSNTIAAGKTLDIASGGSLVNSGSILVAGGEIIDDGSLSGSGTIIIGPHGVVDFAAVPSSGTVVFSGQDGDLQLASLTGLGIAIEDFGPGDTIDLTGIAFAAGDTATYANGLLELFNSSHVLLAELNMTGVLAGEGFAIERDGSGGTKILANLNGTYSGSYTNFLLTATEVDVTFTSAATVTAATGNAITGGTLNAYTVVNSGHISATATHGIGIALQDGGSVSNQGGVIYGGEYGVDITGTAGAVTNTGTITGKTSYGVDLLYGGSVTNAVHGTISGGRGGVAFWNGIGTLINGGRITGASAIGDGVYFREGGYLENKKGGLIKNVGDGVVISPNGSVTNFGSIISTKDDGVVLRGSGTVLNAKGAVIEGAAAGVVADLVINYGTIESSTGYSVGFGDGTLVIEAGSELIGKASGDDGTLELGGGAGSGSIAGIGSGTLSGSTSGTFSGISVYAVGSGADWTLTGSNTIASFETLALLAGGTLVNDGTILMAGGTLDDLGVLTGPGTIEIGNRDTLTLAGAPNSGTIEFLGIGELQLADLNGLGVTIDGIGLGDTIALPGITFAVGDSVSYSGGEIEIFNAGHTLIAEFNANILPGDVVSLQKSAGGYLELVAHGSGTYTGTYSTLRFSASVPVVTIASGAEITGYGAIPAIYAGGDADYTLINYGSIVGNHNFGAGVDFNDGGVVENKAGGVITGATGVVIGGAAGTVFNAGTIDSNSTTIGSAISLTDGGTIDNLKGGLIEGGFVGIEISGAAGTVENAGTIEQGIEIVSGAVSVENSGIITGGVNLQADGNVLNAAGGYIQGSVGVWFERSAGTVTNYGTIVGTQDGVDLSHGGLIINKAGATIVGETGVVVSAATGTVINYGTIGTVSGFGAGGVAVDFQSTSDVLVIDAASKFLGAVIGDDGTLVLGSGAGTGTITGLGSGTLFGAPPLILNGNPAFGDYVVAAGADWVVTGTNTLHQGQTIDVLAGGTMVDAGAIDIGAGATLVDDGTMTGAGSIAFVGAAAAIDLGTPSALGISISGFSFGDTIDLTGVAFQAGDTVTYSSGHLRLYGSGHTLLGSLGFSGYAAGGRLVVVADGHGGSAIVEARAGTYSGVYSNLFLNPVEPVVTITATGTVDATSGAAVSGGTITQYTLVNYGKIEGGSGVVLNDGGSVSNAAGAYVSDVTFWDAPGTVTNKGTINGIDLSAGGVITNSAKALIMNVSFVGSTGVDFELVNSGTIEGFAFDGSIYDESTTVINSGVIEVGTVNGISLGGGTITNQSSGLIEGSGGGIDAVGSVDNAGLIEVTDTAVALSPGGTVTNSGTIDSTGTAGWGIFVDGGSVTVLKGGLIEGFIGVEIGGGVGTLTDYGTIKSTIAGGDAVLFGSATDVLILEAGAKITGMAAGYGGVLELGGGAGAGTINGIGTGTLAGSASATLSAFATYLVGAGSSWTLTGSNTLTAADTLQVNGVLTNSGTFTAAGSMRVGNASVAGKFVNAAGVTFDITADTGIASGAAAGSSFVDSGLLEKTGGTGTSTIAVGFTETGTGSVAVASGTLAFDGATDSFSGAISGAGTLAIAGGGATFNTGAALTVAHWTVSGGSAKIAEALSYAGALTESAGATITVVTGNTLTLTGTNSLSGTVNGGGSLVTAGGGTTTIAATFVVNVANWTVGGTGTAVTLVSGLSYGGVLTAKAGTSITIGSGGVLSLTGHDTLDAAIGGAGALNFAGGSSSTIGAGASLTMSELTFTGTGTTLTFAASLGFAGTFSMAAGTIVSIDAGDALTLSGTGTLAGTIAGAGTLVVGGGGDAFNAGAALTVAKWRVTGGTVNVNEALSYAGTLTEAAGAKISISNGDALTLSGTDTFAGAISGAGTLAVSGGTAYLNAGGALTVAHWSASGGAVHVQESLSYAGALTETAGATISEGTGFTLTLSGTDTLAGTLAGAGTLTIAGGATTLNAGAVVSIGAWTVTGGGTSVSVNEYLSYGHSFSLTGGTVTVAAGDTLKLAGGNTFSGGTLNGGGVVTLAGATTVAGLAIGGTLELYQAANVTENGGTVTIGDALGDKAWLNIVAGWSWNITDNSGIAVGSSTASYIRVAGTLEKTGGTGDSVIAPNITNVGMIAVTSGTLDLAGAITGTGSATIGAGATLEFDRSVASTQTVSFTAGSGELVLNDPSGSHLSFGGMITGFVGSDGILLKPFAYSASTTLAWNQVNGSYGTLTVTDGTKSAVLTIAGTHAATDFTQSQQGTSTLIALASSGAVAHAAADRAGAGVGGGHALGGAGTPRVMPLSPDDFARAGMTGIGAGSRLFGTGERFVGMGSIRPVAQLDIPGLAHATPHSAIV